MERREAPRNPSMGSWEGDCSEVSNFAQTPYWKRAYVMYDQAGFVRKLPKKRRRTEVSANSIGSTDAVGRQNNSPNIQLV
jgi:hypothetical protein